MAEFDKFGSDYKAILDKELRFSGENLDYFADYKARYIRNYLKGSFNGRILDYGCGIGLVAKFLRIYFNEGETDIVGYDISEGLIKYARSQIVGVAFTHDFKDILAQKGTFDIIIMANILHHIAVGKRPEFLQKTTALLKKGGHIFIFEHNPHNPVTRFVVGSSAMDRNASLLKPRDAVRLLKSVNVKVSAKRYIVFFPKFLRILRFFEPMLGCVPAGAQYVCVGQF